MKFEEVYDCSKCGLCLPTCPVFKVTQAEPFSPRGKVQLIKHFAEQDLSSSQYMKSLVSHCLMCGTCTANCPSSVGQDSLFMRMRSSMNADYGQDWYMKILFHFLSHKQQLEFASKLLNFSQRHAVEFFSREIKLGNIPIKRLPRFNKKPFRDQTPVVIRPKTAVKGKILYFTGCATNLVYEDIGKSVVQVLTHMGYQVEIPPEQVCCSIPMFMHGDLKAAQKNILQNIKLFNRSDIDAVVTDCATCGSALKKEYAIVLGELGFDARTADALAEKVWDISEFLYQKLEDLEPIFSKRKQAASVTYHSPCHLRNHQKVSTRIEKLIEAIPGVTYVQAADAESCCGGGGTFFYDHPELSKKIVAKKVANARKTGAQIWATGCPSCRINLAGNLDDADQIVVRHPVQIIRSAL